MLENELIFIVLVVLCLVYSYIIVTSEPQTPMGHDFVLLSDTKDGFESFVQKYKGGQSPGWESDWGKEAEPFESWFNGEEAKELLGNRESREDDFFFDPSGLGQGNGVNNNVPLEPEVDIPSEHFLCRRGWAVLRSNTNFKYLWMHGEMDIMMSSTATMDTPLHRRAFEVMPVDPSCTTGGNVRLREADSKGFVYMVAPNSTFTAEEWTVRIGTSNEEESLSNEKYHFVLEMDGYVFNRAARAFLNVMPESGYTVRGHSGSWDRSRRAGREYGAMLDIAFVDESDVHKAMELEELNELEAKHQDEEELKLIAGFPTSTEKRVISFGLYGGNPKYIVGAQKNVVLAKQYFPGWICRYYVTSDVAPEIVDYLKEHGAEISPIPPGMGYAAGMFWRFTVAVDSTVDRYIIRDVDSRLNARDRIAVEEWINSKFQIHIIRDHVNHCIPMNGGMWGGVRGALPSIMDEINAWGSRDAYGADLNFLAMYVWPEIAHRQIAHDSYCCEKFPNSKPFPTKRPPTYLHVGQVFDQHDHPRLMDIDGFIRGVPIPSDCRKQAGWIYG